ncbi:hypothetical protein BGZ63DRAFT_406790 [Mariannaea sp. PMI_226]|nr:hypothetical protein BGZ63DRAFT_406790 [Mariannaea sp. PMI_226]
MNTPGPSQTPIRKPRKPAEYQGSAGGDVSMTFLVKTNIPSRFSSAEEFRIKGLNAETIAQVYLPCPDWLKQPQYSALSLSYHPDEPSPSIFFSLNISLYHQRITSEDWKDQ